MSFKTTDLCDDFGGELQIAQPIFRSFGRRVRFAGAASTVKCFEDNSRVKEAVAEAGNGRVLVVDAGGSTRCAVLGDLLAGQAAANGWAGIVVYGSVRDTADLAGFDLGILALATMPLRSERKNEGQRDVPVQIPGARIRPGDWIYVDEDGLIVAPRKLTSG
jgi:regulator of ribonuclease activity A